MVSRKTWKGPARYRAGPFQLCPAGRSKPLVAGPTSYPPRNRVASAASVFRLLGSRRPAGRTVRARPGRARCSRSLRPPPAGQPAGSLHHAAPGQAEPGTPKPDARPRDEVASRSAAGDARRGNAGPVHQAPPRRSSPAAVRLASPGPARTPAPVRLPGLAQSGPGCWPAPGCAPSPDLQSASRPATRSRSSLDRVSGPSAASAARRAATPRSASSGGTPSCASRREFPVRSCGVVSGCSHQ
jgi:hypothetical protein